MKKTGALKGQVSLFDLISNNATKTENLFGFLLKPEVVDKAVATLIENKATSLKEEIEENFGYHSTVQSLCSLPATDCNFTSVLSNATIKELSDAVALLTKYPSGNKSRLNACTRKLKALQKRLA